MAVEFRQSDIENLTKFFEKYNVPNVKAAFGALGETYRFLKSTSTGKSDVIGVELARFIEGYNVAKAAISVRMMVETFRVLESALADRTNGTTRNTFQAVVSLGSNLAGNYAGDYNAFKLFN